MSNKIGQINWITSTPKEPEEFGAVEISWQVTAPTMRYSMQWPELEKLIMEHGVNLNEQD